MVEVVWVVEVITVVEVVIGVEVEVRVLFLFQQSGNIFFCSSAITLAR